MPLQPCLPPQRTDPAQLLLTGWHSARHYNWNDKFSLHRITHFKAVDVVSSQTEMLDLASFLRDFGECYGHEFEQQGHQLTLSIAVDCSRLPPVRLVPEALCEALQRIFGNIYNCHHCHCQFHCHYCL